MAVTIAAISRAIVAACGKFGSQNQTIVIVTLCVRQLRQSRVLYGAERSFNYEHESSEAYAGTVESHTHR